MPSIILASGSLIRQTMLKNAGLDFSVIISDFNEEIAKQVIQHLPIPQRAAALARGKAEMVSKKHPDALVIGADQICELDGVTLSKAGNAEKAAQQLANLSGKTHQQHSAVCLYFNGILQWETIESAQLTMRDLSEQEIKDYIKLDEPFSACGSYFFEKNGKNLFAEIIGEADVIQGMPLKGLIGFLLSLIGKNHPTRQYY